MSKVVKMERLNGTASNATLNTSGIFTEQVTRNSAQGHGPQPLYVLILASVSYAAIILLGIIGNSSVIWVTCRYREIRNTAMNIYILNMAIADLTLNVFGAPEVVQFLLNKGWLLGDVACRVNRYCMVTSLYVSILSLLAVTIER